MGVNSNQLRGTKFRFFYAMFVNSQLYKAFLPTLVSAAFIIYVGCSEPRPPPAGPSGLSPDEAREVRARYGAYFPKDVDLGEWTRDGGFEYAADNDMPAFIGNDGDAYAAYECVEVIRVAYAHKSDAGKDIKVTVADMGEADRAYGLFTYLRPDGAEPWDGGDGAERGPTYIAFATDRYYVRVATARDFFGAGAALDELAVGLAVRLPKAGRVPDLINLLPGADIDAPSVKFGTNPAVLVALRPGLEPYLESCAREGEAFVVGGYGENDALLMIAEWDPDDDCEKRFNGILTLTGAVPARSLHGGELKTYKRLENTQPVLLCLNGNYFMEVFSFNDEEYAWGLLSEATGPLVEVSGATINFL